MGIHTGYHSHRWRLYPITPQCYPKNLQKMLLVEKRWLVGQPPSLTLTGRSSHARPVGVPCAPRGGGVSDPHPPGLLYPTGTWRRPGTRCRPSKRASYAASTAWPQLAPAWWLTPLAELLLSPHFPKRARRVHPRNLQAQGGASCLFPCVPLAKQNILKPVPLASPCPGHICPRNRCSGQHFQESTG